MGNLGGKLFGASENLELVALDYVFLLNLIDINYLGKWMIYISRIMQI